MNLKQLKNKKLARNVFSNYIGFVINTLVVLLLTPFLIHRLGSTQYGIWILLNTIMAYFQLMELGTMTAVIRYISHHKAKDESKESESILGSAICLLLIVSLITVPVVYLIADFSPNLFKINEADKALFEKAVWLIGITVITAYFKRLFHAVHEGYQRFDLLNICTASGVTLSAFCTVFFVLKGYGILTLIFILMAQMIYETVFEAVVILRIFKLRINPFAANRANIKKIISFSFFSFLTGIAITISYRIDTVVIGIFLPISAITYYTIGTRISSILEKLTNPLIDTFFPLASDIFSSENEESLRKLLIEGTKISVLMITPGMIIAYWYGSDIIKWWVGNEFIKDSLPVLNIFLVVIFLAVFESTSSQILLGTGNVRFNAGVSFAAATLNITLSFILVQRYGISGVAVGTLIPSILSNLFVSVGYTCRITKTPLVKFYTTVFSPTLLIILISVGFIIMTDSFLHNRLFALSLHSLFACMVTIIVYIKMCNRSQVSEARNDS